MVTGPARVAWPRASTPAVHRGLLLPPWTGGNGQPTHPTSHLEGSNPAGGRHCLDAQKVAQHWPHLCQGRKEPGLPPSSGALCFSDPGRARGPFEGPWAARRAGVPSQVWEGPWQVRPRALCPVSALLWPPACTETRSADTPCQTHPPWAGMPRMALADGDGGHFLPSPSDPALASTPRPASPHATLIAQPRLPSGEQGEVGNQTSRRHRRGERLGWGWRSSVDMLTPLERRQTPLGKASRTAWPGGGGTEPCLHSQEPPAQQAQRQGTINGSFVC